MLVIGPPGSGKTHFVLEALETALRAGRAEEVLLVVPTASMSQHLLHTLARRGLVAPARLVQTLGEFIEGQTPDCREPSPAIAARLLEQALDAADPAPFRSLRGRPGLRETLASVMREFWSAGCDAERARRHCRTPNQKVFAAVLEEYESRLAGKGYAHPAERLRQAAERIEQHGLGTSREVYFDGFLNFTPAEYRLVAAVRSRADRVLVTWPEHGEDSDSAKPFPGWPVQHFGEIRRPRASRVVVRARTPQHEVEEIARRILESKRAFHEVGVVLRSPENYADILGRTFERAGIPYRLRMSQVLRHHGTVAYLVNFLQNVAQGFPGEPSLEVLLRSWSPLGRQPEMEAYDFFVRDQLPGDGLDFLIAAAENFPRVLARLRKLSALEAEAATSRSAREWAQWCRRTRSDWLVLPAVEDGVGMARVLELRATAQALLQFDTATEEAAECLELDGSRKIPLLEYLEALEAVLQQTFLAVHDQRRNVVNVLTVYEARQWELPVVFVCGLVEKQFPRHHPQDLLFADEDRLRLRKEGLQLRTSRDRENEERVLFEIATSRASAQMILTYSQFDEDGRQLLRSFFLVGAPDHDTGAPAVRIRETPAAFSEERRPELAAPDLLEALNGQHDHFSPTALETFIQCPFRFFAGRTLRLQPRPAPPDQRFDARLMGNIVHRAIWAWSEDRSQPIGEVLDEIFQEECARNAIEDGFRTVMIRNALRADLERFASEQAAQRPAAATDEHFESEFRCVVDDMGEQPFEIAGRIDRYEVFGREVAVVTDYKYSTKEQIKRILDRHREGTAVQGPLYLLGLEKEFGVRPAGLRFWGLRGKTAVGGWAVAELLPKDLLLKSERRMNEVAFRSLLDTGKQTAADAIQQIRSGRIAVDPRDTQVCTRFCEFRDVCRIKLWS